MMNTNNKSARDPSRMNQIIIYKSMDWNAVDSEAGFAGPRC